MVERNECWTVGDVEVKTIAGFENYAVSRDGRIWSGERKTARGREYGGVWLIPCKHGSGHLWFDLYRDGGSCKQYAHRLVLETYVGPCPEGLECRHLDGDPANNRLGNLKWGTHAENVQDAVKHGTHYTLGRYGEKHPNSKLSDEDRRLIFSIYHDGAYLQRELGDRFGVARSTISYIIHDPQWAPLDPDPTDPDPEPIPTPTLDRRHSSTADPQCPALLPEPAVIPLPTQTLEQRSYDGALVLIEDAKAASVAETLASGRTDVVNAELKAEWEVELRAVHNDARATTELKWAESSHTLAVGALWKAKTTAAEADKAVETAKRDVVRTQKDAQEAREKAEAAFWLARASWDSKASWIQHIREAEASGGDLSSDLPEQEAAQ